MRERPAGVKTVPGERTIHPDVELLSIVLLIFILLSIPRYSGRLRASASPNAIAATSPIAERSEGPLVGMSCTMTSMRMRIDRLFDVLSQRISRL
jgi:hypothetical protein